MTELFDAAHNEQQLNNGESFSLEVDTDPDDVDRVVVFVDDGTTGQTAAQFTLTAEVWDNDPDPSDWRHYAEEANTTTLLSAVDPAYPPRMQYTIENTSGNANENYRVTVQSIKGEN